AAGPVECPADDDRRLCLRGTMPRGCRKRASDQDERQQPGRGERPPPSSSHVLPPLGVVLIGRLHGTGRYLVKRHSDSRLPDALERLLPPPGELVRRNVPQRVGPRVAKGAVVGEDLEVVVAVPA